MKTFERRDWVAAGALFVAGMVLAVPFRSHLAYHWDSAEFALAIREYNVALSQPHAPGYFLYVMLGKLVNLLVGDPHSSLVWISVIFGGGLAAVMYLLGTAMFDRRTGWASALFAMTSPQVWFHSCVALTYVVDAFLVTLIVFWCWRSVSGNGSWCSALVIGVLLAVVGGVRQQTVPALAPLLVYTFWRMGSQRLAKLVVAGIVTTLLGLAWFAPMVELSGGLPLYLEIVRRHAAFNAPATAIAGGWDACTWNIFWATVFCLNGLMFGGFLLIGGLMYRAVKMDTNRKEEWNQKHGQGLVVLTWWIVPMMASGIFGFTKQPGYVLGYLPGLILLAGLVTAQLRNRFCYWGLIAVVCAVNVIAFLAWPRSWDSVFFGVGRTAREIREHDEQLAGTIRRIRTRFRPSDAVLCHAREYLLFGMRQFQVYLPEFNQYQLALDPAVVAPAGRRMLSVCSGHLEFVSGVELAGRRAVLLVVPPRESISIFDRYFVLDKAQMVSDDLYLLPASPLVLRRMTD